MRAVRLAGPLRAALDDLRGRRPHAQAPRVLERRAGAQARAAAPDDPAARAALTAAEALISAAQRPSDA